MPGWHRQRKPRGRVRDDPFVVRGRSEAEPDPVHRARLAELGQDGLRRFGQAPAGRQRSTDPEEGPGFARTLGRLLGPFCLECCQSSDHDRHGEEQQEVQPFVRVGDRKRELRPNEQEVVDNEGGDRRQDRGGRPGEQADSHHGEQVNRRRVRDRG